MVLIFFMNTIAKPFVKRLTVNHCNGFHEKNQRHFVIKDITQPFYMRACNGVDENFQHHSVKNIDYCITKACITNSITL